MRSIISDRGRYIRTEFAYITKFGRISEISSDMKELCAIRKPAFHRKETVNYDDVVVFV